MLKRNLWKILLSAVIVAWAVTEILPLKDTPFPDYVRANATARQAEFSQLVDEAVARTSNQQAVSEFVALKQIARERKIDLTQYFPDVRIEETLRNVEKRNDILLAELLRRAKRSLALGLDLAGGISVTLEAMDQPGELLDEHQRGEKISKAIEIISARINQYGVAEPIVRQVGDRRIEVQLPGVNTRDNPDIIDVVKAPARLDFRMVHPALVPGPGVETPPGYEIMLLDYEGRRGETAVEEVFVKRIPEMTGEAITNSYARPDLYGRPEVIMEFTREGRQQFAEVTRLIAEGGQRAGRHGRLAVVLDGKLHTAPTVREEINSDSAQISGGNMTDREAINIANVLNNPLDVELKVMEQYEVGPSLARDAIDSGIKASIVAAALIAVFMVLNYTLAGLIAVVSVSFNVFIVLALLASFGATMTMPGIAGIVLTIGMAVDAHILIFERMREELRLGKSLTAAFHAGHEKAFTTIIDANLTTLIASSLMFAFGTGPVKGFGLTLTFGIFATMFTALVFSRMLLEMAIDSGVMKRLAMFTLVRPPSLDFLKLSKPAFIVSWTVVLIGIVGIGIRGSSVYGIDFVGGDEVSLKFRERVDTAKLRAAAEAARVGEVNPLYQSDLVGATEILKIQAETGRGDEAVAALMRAFPNAGLEVGGKNIIGPAIGKEIQRNALMTLGLALAGILLYVAFRFEVGYGVGAVIATIHNVLMTIGIFVLTDRQFTAPMVAAILLIVGYSINDTIVVFDRIREELKLNPIGTLREMINVAIRKVFSRSVITSVTTLLAAFALFLVGGGVINDLSFTFIVGIITGTFASIFIASPVFYWWHKGDRKHVEARHDITPKYEWQGASKASE
jgi:SecD/SecF fusion protein